jgi:hypothetical protein
MEALLEKKLNHVFDVVILIMGKSVGHNRQRYLSRNNNIVTDLIKSAPVVHTSD